MHLQLRLLQRCSLAHVASQPSPEKFHCQFLRLARLDITYSRNDRPRARPQECRPESARLGLEPRLKPARGARIQKHEIGPQPAVQFEENISGGKTFAIPSASREEASPSNVPGSTVPWHAKNSVE